MMKFYAIKRLSDNAFMPAGRARGFTADEPRQGAAPRLFAKRQYAQRALDCWLKGVWESHTVYRDAYYGAEADIDIKVKPRASRRAEDMKVVLLELTEVA